MEDKEMKEQIEKILGISIPKEKTDKETVEDILNINLEDE